MELWFARYCEVRRWVLRGHKLGEDDLIAMYLCGMLKDPDKVSEAEEEIYTKANERLDDLLSEPNPTTQYAYDPEVLRKRDRCKEATVVASGAGAKQKVLDKHLRYFETMTAWYADFTSEDATTQALADAGVQRVRWVTQRDEKVCEECEHLDGLIFPIGRVPPDPHPGCRCYVVPVRS